MEQRDKTTPFQVENPPDMALILVEDFMVGSLCVALIEIHA